MDNKEYNEIKNLKIPETLENKIPINAFENSNVLKEPNPFKEMGTIKELKIPESIKNKTPMDAFEGLELKEIKEPHLEEIKINIQDLEKIIEKSKKDGKILQDVIDKNERNVNFIKNHFKELSEEEKKEILKDNAYNEILKAIPFDNDTNFKEINNIYKDKNNER